MRTRFILIEPSHAGNVGAVARAMKVMGFADLVLVRPRWANVLRREETIQRASGALDVLAHCRVVDRLEDALEGVIHLCATAMTARDFGPPTAAPRDYLPLLAHQHALSGAEAGVAFLFGSERFGMKNEDVYRCHVCLRIPTDPQFGSLNIAAALQLIAYEWRLALGGFDTPASTADSATGLVAAPLADAHSVAAMLAHWQEALVAIDYLDPAAPKKLLPRLQQLFNRAALRTEEIHILRGIAKKMLQNARTHAAPD